MDTLHQTPDSDPDPDRVPPPNITPYFTATLEYWAAVRGLPPEPWTA